MTSKCFLLLVCAFVIGAALGLAFGNRSCARLLREKVKSKTGVGVFTDSGEMIYAARFEDLKWPTRKS